jgi:hypothetical protein
VCVRVCVFVLQSSINRFWQVRLTGPYFFGVGCGICGAGILCLFILWWRIGHVRKRSITLESDARPLMTDFTDDAGNINHIEESSKSLSIRQWMVVTKVAIKPLLALAIDFTILL